ncbi:MAG TPA: NAD(P)/FAD-dependent oxidoreductase [Solirubrobacteraceae bacterium]|nr:NAD(P)/FAD-dependent oxidoreductase [Solirubrobacteraceae bacterium]
MTATNQRDFRVAILGAGFGGLGMAIRLKQAGFDDFVVFERDADVGGTWWANTYPGCQCDIPSHLYSYSFALNPNWTRTYPLQPEIQEYLHDCTDRYGVRPHLRVNCEVQTADWDEDEQTWRLETSDGPFSANVVIAAPGPLSEPSTPDLPGLEDFGGPVFHTGRWDHDQDLTGRKVAVVGTGASAIQTVPRIQPIAEKVTVFQRTPPWVLPHRDRPISDFERRLYQGAPAAQRAVRTAVYLGRELLVPALVFRPQIMRVLQRAAEAHLAKQVPDPVLRAKLTPDYVLGCKRMLPSNDWYPAITQPNVEVVPSAVTEIRPGGIVGADGVEHEADTLIFATGFHVTDAPFAEFIHGRDGVSLSDLWQGSPEAYRGTAVPGFPNLFWIIGANTGLGHSSMVFMIESHLNYVLGALGAMERHGATRIEVRRDAYDAYNDHIQARLDGTVWNTGGCSSWYLDANGRNSTIWPDFTWRFWQQTRRFDEAAYMVSNGSGRALDGPMDAARSAAPIPG